MNEQLTWTSFAIKETEYGQITTRQKQEWIPQNERILYLKYCDMRAETRTVEAEGTAVAREWLINAFFAAMNT
jgi:hypothetical protein